MVQLSYEQGIDMRRCSDGTFIAFPTIRISTRDFRREPSQETPYSYWTLVREYSGDSWPELGGLLYGQAGLLYTLDDYIRRKTSIGVSEFTIRDDGSL